MELKEIDHKTVQSIEANGTTYYLESKISIKRFEVFQMLEVDFGYPGGFAGVYKSLNKSIELLNKQQWVDAAVELCNIRDVMKKSDDNRRQPAVDMCSLFLNTKDEDRTTITNEMLAKKQEDFEKAGIPMDFFLHLAAKLTIGYRESLKLKE